MGCEPYRGHPRATAATRQCPRRPKPGVFFCSWLVLYYDSVSCISFCDYCCISEHQKRLHDNINHPLQFVLVAQQAKLPGTVTFNFTLAEEILLSRKVYKGGIIPSMSNYTSLFRAMDMLPTDGYVTPLE